MTQTALASSISGSKYKKYSTLLTLVVVFLLLTVGLLFINFLSTSRFAKATQSLDISSQQSAISQQLSKNLYDINLYLAANLANAQNATTTPNPVNTPADQTRRDVQSVNLNDLPQTALYKIEEIKAQRDLFAKSLTAFQNGGTTTATNGESVTLDAVTNPIALKSLQATQDIWTPYLGLLDNFIKDVDKGYVSKQTSDYLVDYTRLYNQALQTEANQLTAFFNTEVSQQAKTLQYIQIGGIVLAFILFFSIVFGALRQLLEGDKRLEKARQQTTDILDTVTEGLFLIDKNLVISDEYSRSLEKIVNKNSLQGKTLLDLLKGTVSDQDLDNAKLFIEQLYNSWVVEELIQDLNPLKKIKVNHVLDNGSISSKYLDFNFLRVTEKGSDDINKVFVSVVDITEAVRLQENLEKARAQHDRELEMISTILAVDHQHLLSFIQSTDKRIEKMNNILKLASSHTAELQDKARQLFRETHSLKGDASALQLQAFVGAAEKQEEELKGLLQRAHLTGNDFLPFTVGLNELLDLNQFVSNLLNRLRIVGNQMNTAAINQTHSHHDQQHWQNYFAQYAQDIAHRHYKQVQLTCEGFDDVVNDSEFEVYKDIAIQFLKNAIVHGIETPNERILQGKPEVGQITLSIFDNEQGGKTLMVKDDGQGINLERIRSKAIEQGHVSAEQAATLSDRSLYALMLKSGISTAEQQSEDAGRGVGMDIIYELARTGQGKLDIDSKANEFTFMAIKFPAKNA